jgi:hypothetical protein
MDEKESTPWLRGEADGNKQRMRAIEREDEHPNFHRIFNVG